MSRCWQAAKYGLHRTGAFAPLGYAAWTGARRGSTFCPVACQGDAKQKEADNQGKAFWLSGSSPGNDSVLPAKYDLYSGVIVEPDAVPDDASTFRCLLRSSLAEWMRLEKDGVWLQLGIRVAPLIPIATAEFGFEFHHAERGYVMLTRWLPTNKPSTLPSNASHTVGIGAVVTDSDNRVLLVREKSGPAARLGIWKLPTGLVDAGEDLHAAALREVKEETGVEADFEFLGSFTMSHNGNLAHPNKSSLFFIVKCRARSTDISAQATEIAEARWFTRDEWSRMEFPQKDTLWDALNRSALEGKACIEARQLSLGRTRPGRQWMYQPLPKPAL